MPPPRVHEASAGSDLIGCHSAAVDVEGRLFTWGVGAATGHSTLQPVLLPRSVANFSTVTVGVPQGLS